MTDPTPTLAEDLETIRNGLHMQESHRNFRDENEALARIKAALATTGEHPRRAQGRITRLGEYWRRYQRGDLDREEFEGSVAEMVEFAPAPSPSSAGADRDAIESLRNLLDTFEPVTEFDNASRDRFTAALAHVEAALSAPVAIGTSELGRIPECPVCHKPFMSPDWDPHCSSCTEAGALLESAEAFVRSQATRGDRLIAEAAKARDAAMFAAGKAARDGATKPLLDDLGELYCDASAHMSSLGISKEKTIDRYGRLFDYLTNRQPEPPKAER